MGNPSGLQLQLLLQLQQLQPLSPVAAACSKISVAASDSGEQQNELRVVSFSLSNCQSIMLLVTWVNVRILDIMLGEILCSAALCHFGSACSFFIS